MYKIVTGEQMAEIDRTAIDRLGVPGEQLMENAGQSVARFILRWDLARRAAPVVILCGKGNNGGDGFVAARELHRRGVPCRLFLFGSPEHLKGDAAVNWQRLPDPVRSSAERIKVDEADTVPPDSYLNALEEAGLIVDALFGTGFRGAFRDSWLALLQPLQTYREKILAVDMASGVDSNTATACEAAVRARWTVTMGLPKLGQLLAPGLDHTGHLEVADIGFPKHLLESRDARDVLLLQPKDIEPLLPRRAISAHKGTAGRLYIVAGSPGLTGAAALCGEASLVTGAGLVTLGVPKSLNPILETKLTEVMTEPLPETAGGGLSEEGVETILKRAESVSALAIGPGLGRDPSTAALVRRVLSQTVCPVVLDADGIFAAAQTPDVLQDKPLVMTPHPGELAHFLGVPLAQVLERRWEIARETACRLGVTVVLKGARSVIASPQGEVRINPTGNPAMASAGMGDVLTGIGAALLAQGVPPFEAAQAAVFIHGLAADLCVADSGYAVVTAQEVSDAVREAIRGLMAKDWDRAIAPPPRLESSSVLEGGT